MWECRVLRTWECQCDIHSPHRQYCGEVVIGAFVQRNVACLAPEVGVAQCMGRVMLRSPHMVGVASTGGGCGPIYGPGYAKVPTHGGCSSCAAVWAGVGLQTQRWAGSGGYPGGVSLAVFPIKPSSICVVSGVELYILCMWLVCCGSCHEAY